MALEAWRYTYRGLYDAAYIEAFVHTHYAPNRLAGLAPQVQSGAIFFEVAVQQEQIVGYCHLGFTKRGAELFRLYLLPASIGQGIGGELLQRGEAFVMARGVYTYGCFVHKDNELGKRFYQRHGFRYVAVQDQAEDWYMEKSLAEEGNTEGMAGDASGGRYNAG